jgi:hypothetical protein
MDNSIRPPAPALVALAAAPVLTLVADLVQVPPAAHDTASELTSIAAHTGRYQLSAAIGFLALVLSVPAYLALGAPLRRSRPRVWLVGVSMSVTGVLALVSLMGSGPYSQALAESPQRTAAVAVTDAAEGMPLTTAWMVLFLVGAMLGPIVLGVGLWRTGYGWGIPALLVLGLGVQMADLGFWPLALGYALTAAGLVLAAVRIAGRTSVPFVEQVPAGV